MGWNYESEDRRHFHEGHTVGVLANGVIPTYRPGGDQYPPSELGYWEGGWGGGPEDDPGEEPAWLLPKCDCGWRGQKEPREPDGAGAAEERGRQQWLEHTAGIDATIAPLALTDAIGDLVTVLESGAAAQRPMPSLAVLHSLQATVEWAITETVGAARAERPQPSWAKIGGTLRLGRQTAWERYRQVEDPPSPRPELGED